MKTLLYHQLKQHITRLSTKIDSTERVLVLDTLVQELAAYETQLSVKIGKALETMN